MRNYRFVLLAAVLLALFLRLTRITFQPLWWDEGWSLYFAATDLGAMLELTAVDIHPPFYYLLLHLWTQLFGPSPFSVRLLSVVVGTLTVSLLYATGRRLLGAKGGLVAAFLLAISPFHIYYSQEVRMYGLVTLLGLAAFYFTLRWIMEIGDWRHRAALRRRPDGPTSGKSPLGSTALGIGYVLAATAALYTQYYAAFLLLAINLAALIYWCKARPSARKIIHWLGAQVGVGVLFLPWLLYAGEKLFTYVRFKVGVEGDLSYGLFTYLGRHLAALNWGHAEGILAEYWWFGLLPLVVLAALFFGSGRKGMGELVDRVLGIGYWPLITVVVTLACGFVVNLVFPFNPPRSERLLLLVLPCYLLLFAASLLVLWRYRRSLAVLAGASFFVVAILSLLFLYTVPRYLDDDYRPVAERLRALASPGDAVIAVHPWQVGYLHAYIPDDEARPNLVLTPREVIPRERQLWADDPALMAADLDALLSEYGRLWLLDHQTMGRVLEKQIEAYLSGQAYHTFSEWHGESTMLSLFAAGEPAAQPIAAQFGEWLTLEGAALNPEPLEAGWDVLTTDLTWRLSERPDERYHVGLRLVDQTGRVWAQRDSTPNGGLAHFFDFSLNEPHLDRHGLLVPAGTPSGDYFVTLRVYRSQDIAVLPVTFEGGSGGEVTLGTVRVTRPKIFPPVEALPIEQPLQANFGDRLQFLGCNIHNEAVLRPGEAVEVELFWQALADPGEDFLPRLQLFDSDDASVAELVEKPVAGAYPTAWWKASELVRDPHALPVPATVPAGRYRLALSLIRASDGNPVETKQGMTAVDLAEVEVQDREHHYFPTFPAHFQQASLGPSVELMGYDMREAVRAPGSPLEVTLHWHALETPDRNYHSFVHLLDADDNIVAQHDGVPGEGELPTLGWLPGEYLTDTHLIQLPFELSDGVYRLGVGLYDPSTNIRLGERVILNRPVPVKARGGCNCR